MYRLYSELAQNRSALLTLVQFNLKSTVSATRLGFVWWILDPLVQMAIYYFIVKIIFERGEENYHLFLLSGILAWQTFAKALRQSSRSISTNRALIRQIGIPIATITAIPVFVQIVYAVIGLAIVMLWRHGALGLHSLAVIPLLLLIALFSYGLGLLLSVCNAYYKDTDALLGYVLRLGFFLTPVLYPVSRILEAPAVPEYAKTLYMANPMAWIVTRLRDLVLTGTTFEWGTFAGLLIIALSIVQLGLYCVRRQSTKIARML
ncbi:MAG: ABC transporter permease [Gammaproteobacteria bacterium]